VRGIGIGGAHLIRLLISGMNKITRCYQVALRLWSARHHYGHWRDWLFSFYHRLLLRYPNWPLARRHRILRVRLSGIRQPFYVRLGTSDWYVLEDIFIRGEYAPLIHRKLQNVQCIVDLGANVGFSLRLWQQVYPTAAIIAVEPDAANMRLCARNALAGPRYGIVQFVQACAVGKPRLVALDRSEGEWQFKIQATNSQSSERIQAMTLPQLIGDREDLIIDLLKCDIEGAEAEVFADCKPWIKRVRNLVVELHHPYRTEQFLVDLSKNGGRFNVYFKDERIDTSLLFLEQVNQE